jgi:hypothetical protein
LRQRSAAAFGWCRKKELKKKKKEKNYADSKTLPASIKELAGVVLHKHARLCPHSLIISLILLFFYYIHH